MKKRILFVCQANICRSPAAEAVFNRMLKDAGMEEYFEIDSAGTIDWYEGEPADKRMQEHSQRRGYFLESIARKFQPASDFQNADRIIAMDHEIFNTLVQLSGNETERAKICKMNDFSKLYGYDSVPDPFYGGEEGFELVLDLLEDACQGLLEDIKSKSEPEKKESNPEE